MKQDRIYIILVLGLFLLLMVFLWMQPTEISWNHTYTKKDTQPFASKAVYELLGYDVFPGQTVTPLYIPASELERDLRPDSASGKTMNYLLIRDMVSFDEYDTKALCQLADAGNHIFVSGQYAYGPLADTLGISTQYQAWNGQDIFADPDTIRLNFHAPFNVERSYGMRPGDNTMYIYIPDSVKDVEVLGRNSLSNPVFVKKRLGRGYIYFHSVPLAFTNYYLLQAGNSGYVSRCFSHLPVAPVYWDEYYKVGRQGASTPIRVLLQHPALKMAWILILLFGLLYMLFQSKRRQRIIPVLKPFENSTLQFVGTVARLYYNRGDHTSLAKKKVTYFLERLRLRYQMPVDLLDPACMEAIGSRAGVDAETTKAVFAFTHHIRMANNVSERELIDYNKKVEEFWKRAK